MCRWGPVRVWLALRAEQHWRSEADWFSGPFLGSALEASSWTAVPWRKDLIENQKNNPPP